MVGSQKEELFVIFDLDGVIMDEKEGANLADKADFYITLSKLAERFDLHPSVLTNRPAGQCELVAHDLNIRKSNCEFVIGECGAVAFDYGTQTQIINPLLMDYIQFVRPKLIQFLQKEIRMSSWGNIQEMPGGNIVKIEVIFKNLEEKLLALEKITGFLSQQNLEKEVYIENRGNRIILYPKSCCDKQLGISWFGELYRQRNDHEIEWNRVIFIADSHRTDGPAATQLSWLGGKPTAVCNASTEYKKIVEQCGGYVANHGTKRDSSVVEILGQFLPQPAVVN